MSDCELLTTIEIKQMRKEFIFKILLFIIFLIALLLRLGLAVFNRDFNDNHLYPVRFIMLTNKLPKGDTGGESYQPKLYHYVVAKTAREFGISPNDKNGLILTGQWLNFIASVLILAIVWLFLKQLPIHDRKARFGAFALTALNPALIGINGQATNDTFVILFSTLAIYFVYLFIKKEYWITALFAVLCASLAVASKTNGWTTTIAIFLALVFRAISKKASFGAWMLALAFPLAVAVLSFADPLTQYQYNYKHYGSPVLINMERPPMPGVVEKTDFPYAGIVSIQDGFFTFKYFDLLKTPYIENYEDIKQPARTSFWTMLYARGHSLHFDKWPPTWSDSGTWIFMLTRSIFIFALLPTFLVFLGAYTELVRFLSALYKRLPEELSGTNFGLFLLLFGGYLAFVFLYTLEYRVFTVMKVAFILPALLSFVLLFAKGAEQLYSLLPRWQPQIVHVIDADFVVLLCLYTLEVSTLILKLSQTPSPFS